MAGPSSTTDRENRRPPLCASAPLLWSLLPLVAGILVAKWALWPWVGPLAGVAFMSGQRGSASARWVILLSFIAGMALMSNRLIRPHPDWYHLPPREATALLHVGKFFNTRKPGILSGIGELRRVEIPHDTVSGHLAAFHLADDAGRDKGTGQVFLCRGVLTYLPHLEEPDDFQLYLLSRDIYFSFTQGTVLQHVHPPGRLEQLRLRLHQSGQELLTTGCLNPSDNGHVLASMLLGNRTLLTDDRIALYRQTGTYHLFAVSGLHVGSFAMCLYLVLGLARVPGIWRVPPLLVVTWSYVWLTGASPSAVRAGIMISSLSLSRHFLRQPHLFPAMVLSAWVVLLWDPRQLFDLGFQLSYGVVGAIILMGLPMAQHLRLVLGDNRSPGWKKRLHKAVLAALDILCVSISAGLCSAPLIIQHFELFTPGGLLAGILLNPLATLTVMAGSLSLLLFPLKTVLPVEWLVLGTWPLIDLIEGLLGLCLRIPGAAQTRVWLWPHTGNLLVAGTLALAWSLQALRQGGRILHPATYLLPAGIILAGIFLASVNS